jgi:RNA polymerase sigma-70 factor (sigma-E family)
MRGGGDASAHEDALLSRMYQQIAEVREPQFAAGYDLEAGLDRYRAWLGAHAVVAASGTPAAEGGQTSTAAEGGQTSTAAEGGQTSTAAEGGQISTADVTMPLRAVATEPAAWSAELAVIELYSVQYKALVRLAAMLVRDISTAEEVVQDAFIAMHDGWHRLKDTEKALAYLRQAVVNRSRSVLRHRVVVEKNAPKPAPDMPSAEHGAMALLERSAVIAALRDLPARQREAIVLRYYADLSEADIAAAMEISRGAVKSHTARGMASLKAALEQDS